MAKQPGSEQLWRRKPPPRHDLGTAAINLGNLPQQIPLLDWRIFLVHAVATRDEKRFFA
jgi:hypothetical protein